VSATNLFNVAYQEVLHFPAPGRLWYLGVRIGR
jgi:outer membrane cobalamin receptor